MSCSPTILIIGYGSELRGDDAVGRRVAEAVAAWNRPRVRAVSIHQLTPELADPISQAAVVVFVDASIASAVGEPIRLQSLRPSESSEIGGHVADPRTLLALSALLYGPCPIAYWLTIPAERFELGGDLSPTAQQGIAAALDCLQSLFCPGHGGLPPM